MKTGYRLSAYGHIFDFQKHLCYSDVKKSTYLLNRILISYNPCRNFNLNFNIMKKSNQILLIVLSLALFAGTGYSQPADQPAYLTVTTVHWKMDNKDFSMDKWKAVEKEYFDKVTSKNEYILGSLFLIHFFTTDNSELKVVNVYSSWENIDKAGQRGNELAEAAWPDKEQRTAFFKSQSDYYTNFHSDEIYSTLPYVKQLASKPTEPLIYYINVSQMDFPEGGTQKESGELMTEYFDKVISKNPAILAYYPSRHAWGANSQDFLQAYVVKSFEDIVKALDGDTELEKSSWTDETARKDYFAKRNKYFTGQHADFIYTSVPELTK